MENSAATRKIVEASWQAVAKAGVRKFRVSDVAAAAGVSVGLVYYHFESRNGLLKATMEFANEITPGAGAGAGAVGSGSGSGSGTGFERLEALLLADFDGTERAHDNAVVWHELVGVAVFEEEIRDQVGVTLAKWRDAVADAVSEGQRDGSIRAGIDAARAARSVTALADGLLSGIVVGSSSWDEARDALRAALERLLRAE
ncbi:TetR/AcrR family transcriptional regulator [Leucobacter luti]|uniref:TetR/AcrR family transcriptional regulator n=1 Tax=Leucobacter luti TaxID=340320 RepID=UPI003D04F6F7